MLVHDIESRIAESTRRVRRHAFAVAVTLLLLGSVALNVVLARRAQFFRRLQSTKASERLLKVGAVVPPIVAKRLDGQPGIISFLGAEQPTVLYIFTPPCSWCARNLDNFKTLVDNESGGYRFIGLSLSEEGLAEYVSKSGMKVPVYTGLSSETRQSYKLSGTPQTIVVSPDGHVLQNWMGAYVGNQKSQVEAFFHVNLPGLREISKAEGTKQNEVQPQAVN